MYADSRCLESWGIPRPPLEIGKQACSLALVCWTLLGECGSSSMYQYASSTCLSRRSMCGLMMSGGHVRARWLTRLWMQRRRTWVSSWTEILELSIARRSTIRVVAIMVEVIALEM